jgi:hypothetical protein
MAARSATDVVKRAEWNNDKVTVGAERELGRIRGFAERLGRMGNDGGHSGAAAEFPSRSRRLASNG